jgi:hypothetical protein
VGEAAPGFANAALDAAYIPLRAATGFFSHGFGAGVVIAPGVAVTNAHNANLLAGDAVIGKAAEGDLLFFRTGRRATLPQATPRPGEAVIAYGQGAHEGLRMAEGRIYRSNGEAFSYRAQAGKGFSGGPVIDARDGRLLGITYGFSDAKTQRGTQRYMLAYTMGFVMAQWARLGHEKAAPIAGGTQ